MKKEVKRLWHTRGNSKNIIVGAASLFIYAEGPVNDPNVDNAFPNFVGESPTRKLLIKTQAGLTLDTLRMVWN